MQRLMGIHKSGQCFVMCLHVHLGLHTLAILEHAAKRTRAALCISEFLRNEVTPVCRHQGLDPNPPKMVREGPVGMIKSPYVEHLRRTRAGHRIRAASWWVHLGKRFSAHPRRTLTHVIVPTSQWTSNLRTLPDWCGEVGTQQDLPPVRPLPVYEPFRVFRVQEFAVTDIPRIAKVRGAEAARFNAWRHGLLVTFRNGLFEVLEPSDGSPGIGDQLLRSHPFLRCRLLFIVRRVR